MTCSIWSCIHVCIRICTQICIYACITNCVCVRILISICICILKSSSLCTLCPKPRVCCICFCIHISNCVFVLMFPSVFVVVCLLLELCCRHSLLLCHSPVKYYATTPYAQSTGLLPVPSSCEIMLPVQFVYSSSLNHTGFMESVNSFSKEIICHHWMQIPFQIRNPMRQIV